MNLTVLIIGTKMTKFTPMLWRVSQEYGGEVMEADQNPLNPGQQEDLVLPSGEGHRYLKIQTYIFGSKRY